VKKHFNKLIVGILLVLAVGAGVLENIINPAEANTEQEQVQGAQLEVPKDYIISKSIDILVNEDNYIHTDETIIKGILSDIVYSGDSIGWLVVATENGSEYKIAYENIELISTKVIQTEEIDGLDEVHLYFRTGGDIALIEGEDIKLYRTASGGFSFDEREHDRQQETEFHGTIIDFVFLPTVDQNGNIYISHLIVEDKDGGTTKVYLHNLETKSIKSEGDLRVFYIGNAYTSQVFDIDESGDFAITMQTEEETYILQKGQEIALKNNESKGYWEIKDAVDSGIYKAEVTGFDFGFTGDNITSLDYINLDVDGEDISMTMLQTNAEYAIPYGNYKKIYKYEGHDKILSEIEPLEEFLIEMYYEDDIMLELSIGAQIWVYQNSDGIWTIDYTYEEQISEEETSN